MKISQLARIMAVFVGMAVLLVAAAPKIQAAGSPLWPNVRLSANSSSAQANGSDTITVTASFYVYECNNGQVYDSTAYCDQYGGGVKKETPYDDRVCPYSDTITVNLNVVGDGAILSKTSLCGGTSATDTFTVKSSVIGTKTITPVVSWSYSSATQNGSPISLNFTNAVAAPAPAKPKTTPAPAAPAPAPVVEKPAAPTVATITAGSEEVKIDEPVSITMDEPLVLSGKTVPNGKVAVYVFSDPKLFETTADAEGNWSVKVEGLPEGSHHAEVEVTNPANNQKSDRTKLLEFSVVAAQKPLATNATTTTGPKKASKIGLWVGVGVLILIAGVVTFLVWRRKRQIKRSDDGPSHQNPPAITPSDASSTNSSASSPSDPENTESQ